MSVPLRAHVSVNTCLIFFFFSQQAAAWAASEHRETVGEKVGERCGETAENKIKSLHESPEKDTGHVLYMFMSAGAPCLPSHTTKPLFNGPGP